MDPTSSLSGSFADLSVDDRKPAYDHSAVLDKVSWDRDGLIDADHESLDAKIHLTFRSDRKYNEEPHLPSLLSNITLNDERLVTLSDEDAEKLLDRHPSLVGLLRNAWKEGSFKEIRRLQILWPEVRDTPKRRPLPRSENVELTDKALRSAWRDIYSGNNHRLLFANINALSPTDKPYSNQIAIVQSSGTGKSRMVHEQANLVFTIPFNLREKADSRDLAFPVPDDDVRRYLVADDDERILKEKYLKFFGGLFTQINKELETCEQELRQVKTADELAKWWSGRLEGGLRKTIYKGAIEEAGEAIKILPDMQKRHDELLIKRRSGKEDTSHPDYGVESVAELAAAVTARDALTRLMAKLKGPQRIKLIIYFDEAHPLTKPNGGGKTLYDHLCSCLNQFLLFPIFWIFLSTNSSLAYFASPQSLAKSARIRGGNAITHAPITETPFDCSDELKVQPGKLKMKDISTIPFMAQFGRPLFWTLLRGAGLNASELYTEVLELARAKLVASREIDSDYTNFSITAKLAVLDVQISLDYEPRREKVQMEEAKLVESHMRIAYSIPEHREYLRSGYPSEPLLAEAAAQQLWRWRRKHPFAVVETLTQILGNGLLSRGELGELTGRQLLLDAYQRAVEVEQAGREPPNFSAGCRLITFIEHLFTEDYASTLLAIEPDNRTGVPFRAAFGDARVCFTHFGKMADATGITSAAAWAAFIRHMAIMCRNNQESVDCVIPVLLWDTEICEHVMTGLLVQFKRREKKGTVARYSIDEKKVGFFPKKLEDCRHGSNSGSNSKSKHRPYISLVMELGIQPNKVQESSQPEKKTDKKTDKKKATSDRRTPPPRERVPEPETPSDPVYVGKFGKKHHDPIVHPRYNVFVYGFSPTVYRGIDKAHKAAYAHLLGCRDFISEHPRQNEETLKAVRRMKPFWTTGNNCYHWITHDDILHRSQDFDDKDVVVEFSAGYPSSEL